MKPSRTFVNMARATRRPSSRKTGKDRKSTRLNSSHGYISYAVFCLKKKNQNSGYVAGEVAVAVAPEPAHIARGPDPCADVGGMQLDGVGWDYPGSSEFPEPAYRSR